MLLAAKMPLELDTYVPPFAIHHSRHCDQLDYSELNLAESDSSSSSMIGLMQSSECCRRAKKGSIIEERVNYRFRHQLEERRRQQCCGTSCKRTCENSAETGLMKLSRRETTAIFAYVPAVMSGSLHETNSCCNQYLRSIPHSSQRDHTHPQLK